MAAGYFSDKEHSIPDEYFEEVSKPDKCISIVRCRQELVQDKRLRELRGLMTENVNESTELCAGQRV